MGVLTLEVGSWVSNSRKGEKVRAYLVGALVAGEGAEEDAAPITGEGAGEELAKGGGARPPRRRRQERGAVSERAREREG